MGEALLGGLHGPPSLVSQGFKPAHSLPWFELVYCSYTIGIMIASNESTGLS